MMKIADFGLARDIHHIDYYKKTTNVSAGAALGARPLPGAPLHCGGVSHVQPCMCPRLPRATASVPVLLAGPTACQVDGTRGLVRPDLHPPERRVSLK